MKKKYVLLVGAAVMILGIATSETYAVFQADGNNVQTHISTNSLDIAINEKSTQVTFDDLVPNQKIDKEMSVSNVENTSLYTRVTIQKYWLNANGEKDFEEDASNIKLQYNKEEWLEEYVDEENGEEVVLYYKKPLAPQEVSETFLQSIQVPENLNNQDMGKTFALDIKVDAVQSIDGVNAMLSQWGVLATLENGEIVKVER